MPGSVKGYCVAAASLSELGRAVEAEALLMPGLTALPKNASIRIEYARLADRRNDWEAALLRWTEVLEICGHLAGAVGMATALAKLGRYDEADKALFRVVHKAGSNVTIRIGLAQVAEQKKIGPRRWRGGPKFGSDFHSIQSATSMEYRSLVEIGKQKEADETLLEGIARMPCNPALLVEYARLAHCRSEWDEAARRWAEVRERFPNKNEGYANGADALAALGQASEAERVGLTAPVPA